MVFHILVVEGQNVGGGVVHSVKVCLFVVSMVAGFAFVGCSHRSRKQKKEPLQITTTTLPAGYEGQTGYSAQLTATGGTGSYSWGIVSGSLPPFLSFDSSGLIRGDIASTASSGSPYDLTVEVTDGQQTVQANFSITVYAQLQITTGSLPNATEGVVYSCTVSASGGDGNNYTWSVSGQPSWLSVDSSTGDLSGTPPVGSAGTYTLTVEVTDGQQTASKQFDLAVITPTPPKADFEANQTEGAAPLTVNFTNKSTGSITQWQWDFDNDGTVDSTQQSPTHTYNNPGWYTVKLTVTGPVGSDSCVKERFILVADKTWYVNGNGGDDASSGTSWSDAFATIGKALSVASDYDVVLVADTTYNETDLNFNGKKIYLKGVAHNTAGAQPVIDCQQAGRAFYFGSGETKDSVIDNFVIRNGKVKDAYGGAIVCENNSSLTIRNCVFENNKTEDTNGADDSENGGAIYCYGNSSPTLMNCTFSGNGATGGYSYGGAIYCYDNCSLTMINCTFSGNSATWDGGAFYCSSSSATITNCTFDDNSAGQSGGAIYCHYSGPTIRNCVFSNNYAPAEGGAIACNAISNATVTNCTFNGNRARQYGGAISCVNFSSPTITNCLFTGNSVIFNAGVLYCGVSSNPTLTNCTFSGNSASGWGGVIWCYDSSSPTLHNCILWGNSAGRGGSSEIAVNSGCTVTLNYCCVDNTGYGGGGTVDDSNNCIHSDPEFVDAANGDFHLKDTSPCIDVGDNGSVPSGAATDLDGNPRIANGTVDIGAYERQ